MREESAIDCSVALRRVCCTQYSAEVWKYPTWDSPGAHRADKAKLHHQSWNRKERQRSCDGLKRLSLMTGRCFPERGPLGQILGRRKQIQYLLSALFSSVSRRTRIYFQPYWDFWNHRKYVRNSSMVKWEHGRSTREHAIIGKEGRRNSPPFWWVDICFYDKGRRLRRSHGELA